MSIGPFLSGSQKRDIKLLVEEYRGIFTEKLGLTNIESHSKKLIDGEPFKERPYLCYYRSCRRGGKSNVKGGNRRKVEIR